MNDGGMPTLAGAAPIDAQGEQLILLPDRAVFWPGASALIVADVHLGKAQVLRHHGIPVPRGSTSDDLERLDALIRATNCTRLLVLGDLVHAPGHVDLPWRRRLQRWRDSHRSLTMTVVAGNHDRGTDLPALGFQLAPDALRESVFEFAHAPAADARDGRLRLCGHVHPVVVRRDHVGRLRLPVFWHRANELVLPAFGALTGGFEIRPAAGERAYAVTGERVIPLDL
jgi:DNA ligase-associated metallophosphoesterase